jgi:Fanconi-associated nuclease 1
MYAKNLPRFEEIVESWKGTNESPRDIYLLRFTEEWVIARVMRQCLAALQRLRKYEEAVSLLKLLLRYTPMSYKRGSWWENLALILHFHLKKPDAARKAASAGLADPFSNPENKIALEFRLGKLDRKFTPEFTFEPKKVTIEVVAVEGSGSTANSKKIWLGNDNGESVLCGVEDVTLNYYINNFNFKEGFHCEGAIVSTLFAIFCWDLIFCDVDNVFYNKYQYCPLDIYSKEFYTNRKDRFGDHFNQLRELSEGRLSEIVAQTWELHYGTGCEGLNWELFADMKHCQRCVACITPPKLASLLEEYVIDVRGRRGGVPDLSIWNYENREFVMVEVKGPGDSLSNKQRVWLSRLDKIGIRAELCLVKAVSSKKLN